MKYLNETGITDVITNWLKHASNSLSDVFKGGKIDLSAKNRQLVAEYLGDTKQGIQSNVEWMAGKKKVTGDSTKITKKTTDAGKRGSKSWNEAKKKIKETKGKGVNTQTASKEDAERLINEARPELEKRPTYSKGGKSGYEFHPAEPEVGNDKPHVKWWDWSKGKAEGAEGHIYHD